MRKAIIELNPNKFLKRIQPNFDIMSIDGCQSEASPNIERLGLY